MKSNTARCQLLQLRESNNFEIIRRRQLYQHVESADAQR